VRLDADVVARLAQAARDVRSGATLAERLAALDVELGPALGADSTSAVVIGSEETRAALRNPGSPPIMPVRADRTYTRHYDLAWIEDYGAHYAARDPVSELLVGRPGRSLAARRALGSAWGRDAATGEFFPRTAVTDYVGAAVPLGGGLLLSLGFFRRSTRRCGDREEEALDLAIPAIATGVRGVLLGERLAASRGAQDPGIGSLVADPLGGVLEDAGALRLLGEAALPPERVGDLLAGGAAAAARGAEVCRTIPLCTGGWARVRFARLDGPTAGVAVLADVLEPGTVARLDAFAAACSLTPREREVALALAEGLSHGEVASALEIATETAKRHAAAVYRKAGVASPAALAAAALGHEVAPHRT